MELFRSYGAVLQQMGDLRQAGKFFFLSGSAAPEHAECIHLFLERDTNKSFSDFWKSMPKAAQKADRSAVPKAVLDQFPKLGFRKSDVNSVFRTVERARKARPSAADDSDRDWVGVVFMVLFLLFFIGLSYQAIVGLIGLFRLIANWIG